MSVKQTSVKEFEQKMGEIRLRIKENVTPFRDDTKEKQEARKARARVDKLYFAKTYFPHYIESRFSPIHKLLFKLTEIMGTPVVLAMFRGAGKSVLITLIDKIHKIVFEERWFIIIMSETEGSAMEHTGSMREELEHNKRLLHDFGQMKKLGSWEGNDFTTANGRRVLALGRTQTPRDKRNGPHRPDDFTFDGYENPFTSYNPVMVKKGFRRVKEDALGSVDIKRFSFMYLGNYFSKTSVIHECMEMEGWIPHIIPAEENGKSTWPARFSLKILRHLKKIMGSVSYDIEMLQIPRDDIDQTFRDEWFKRCVYAIEDLAEKQLQKVIFLDPAIGMKEKHSFKAMIAIGREKTGRVEEPFIYYVLKAWIRKKVSLMGMGRAAYEMDGEIKPRAFGIEKVAFQAALKPLFNTLQTEFNRHLPIRMIAPPKGLTKEDRIARRSPMIENGTIRFLPGDSDQDELIRQYKHFDNKSVALDGPDAADGAISMLEGPKKKNIRVLGV